MRTLAFLALILLAGCDSNKVNLDEACESMGKMCINLSKDSRCSSLRRDVIVQAYKIKKEVTPKAKYNQLLSLEKYVECAEKSTWVEYKDPVSKMLLSKSSGEKISPEDLINLKKYQKRNKEAKERRNVSFYTSKKLLSDLNSSVENNKETHLLYWNWTRNGDESAMKKLIRLDDQGKVNDSLIIFSLAEELIRVNKNKGIAKMIRSLSKYPEDQYVKQSDGSGFDKLDSVPNRKLHIQILQSLSSSYFRKKEYEKSYIFAKLLMLNGNNTADPDMILSRFDKKNIRLIDGLDDKADLIHKKLKNGEFNLNCEDFRRYCKKS